MFLILRGGFMHGIAIFGRAQVREAGAGDVAMGGIGMIERGEELPVDWPL